MENGKHWIEMRECVGGPRDGELVMSGYSFLEAVGPPFQTENGPLAFGFTMMIHRYFWNGVVYMYDGERPLFASIDEE